MPKTKKKLMNTTPTIDEHIQSIGQETQKKQEGERVKFSVVNWYPGDSISYSALTSFENCSVCFYLHYYQGIKWPPKASMKDGLAFQEALNKKHQGEPYLSEIQKVGKPNIALDLIKQTDAHMPVGEIISLDKEYIVDIGLDLPLKFIPDVLTKDSVIEHKYTTGYYNAEMVKTQKQSTIYYIGVKKLLGFEPKIQYWLFNTKKKKLEVVNIEKTEYDAQDTLYWMKNTLDKIKECYNKKQWIVPKHGNYPCDLKGACPILHG